MSFLSALKNSFSNKRLHKQVLLFTLNPFYHKIKLGGLNINHKLDKYVYDSLEKIREILKEKSGNKTLTSTIDYKDTLIAKYLRENVEVMPKSIQNKFHAHFSKNLVLFMDKRDPSYLGTLV